MIFCDPLNSSVCSKTGYVSCFSTKCWYFSCFVHILRKYVKTVILLIICRLSAIMNKPLDYWISTSEIEKSVYFRVQTQPRIFLYTTAQWVPSGFSKWQKWGSFPVVIRESYLSYLITIGVSVGPPFSSSSRSTACAMMIIFHLIDDVMMIILYLSMSSCCCRDDVVREKLQFCVEIPPGVLEQRGHEKDLPEKKDLFFTGGQTQLWRGHRVITRSTKFICVSVVYTKRIVTQAYDSFCYVNAITELDGNIAWWFIFLSSLDRLRRTCCARYLFYFLLCDWACRPRSCRYTYDTMTANLSCSAASSTLLRITCHTKLYAYTLTRCEVWSWWSLRYHCSPNAIPLVPHLKMTRMSRGWRCADQASNSSVTDGVTETLAHASTDAVFLKHGVWKESCERCKHASDSRWRSGNKERPT